VLLRYRQRLPGESFQVGVLHIFRRLMKLLDILPIVFDHLLHVLKVQSGPREFQQPLYQITVPPGVAGRVIPLRVTTCLRSSLAFE
jgi:hypothetical protein